jgi:HSP20 family molecular chaperone IbpA
VEVDKGVLTITGQVTWAQPGEGYSPTYVGFSPGSFFRAFALSDEIDREKITAQMTAGVLTLHLPKAESARTRQIPIQTD